MSDPVWADILAVVNAGLAIILTVVNLRLLPGANGHSWVRWAFAGIGFYWAVLYTFVVIVPAGVLDPVWFGRIWVRPAFTVTLAVMTSSAVFRWRSLQHEH